MSQREVMMPEDTLLDTYEILGILGKGSYGKVYKARRRIDGHICVIKEVRLEGITPAEKEEALNESKLMSQIDHFHVIRLEEAFVEDETLFIVMEFAAGGDLYQKIKNQIGHFTEETLWTHLIQIAQGLECLHENRILHRDIKPQNILLDASGNIKIGDFGLGRALSAQSHFAYTGVGTPLYVSPEMVQEHPYDTKSDIWALGCLMYEMASKRPPFLATNQIALANKIVTDKPAPLPKVYSAEIQFLIFKMLEKDPLRRPDIAQILNYSAVKFRIERSRLQAKEKEIKSFMLKFSEKVKQEFGMLENRIGSQMNRIEALADAQNSFLLPLQSKNQQLEGRVIDLQRQMEVQKENHQRQTMRKNNLILSLERRIEDLQKIVNERNAATPSREVEADSTEELDVSRIILVENPVSPFSIMGDSVTLWEDKRSTEPTLAEATKTPETNERTKRTLIKVNRVEGEGKENSLNHTPSPKKFVQKVDPSIAAAQQRRRRSMTPSGKDSPTTYNHRTSPGHYFPFSLDSWGITASEEQTSPFHAVFAWRKGPVGQSPSDQDRSITGKVWNNKEKHLLLGGCRHLLLLYKINPMLKRQPEVKGLRVRYQYECEFVKINRNSESAYTLAADTFYVEVPAGKEEIIEFILEFDTPNAADEVVAIKWEKRLMEQLNRSKRSTLTPLQDRYAVAPTPIRRGLQLLHLDNHPPPETPSTPHPLEYEEGETVDLLDIQAIGVHLRDLDDGFGDEQQFTPRSQQMHYREDESLSPISLSRAMYLDGNYNVLQQPYQIQEKMGSIQELIRRARWMEQANGR